jgi:hypothetical protein
MNKTPFKDINALLEQLILSVTEYFGEDLVGVYLYGSLVWGDFNYTTSDIDILVVLTADVSQEDFSKLDLIHKSLISTFTTWNDRLEIGYVSTSALHELKHTPQKIALMSPGEAFHIKTMDTDWLINCYLLQIKSIILFGPDPKQFSPTITQAEFVKAVKDTAISWRGYIYNTEHALGYQYYLILTMCRAFYVTCFGKQSSKAEAANWAMKTLTQWKPLIKKAKAYFNPSIKGIVFPETDYDEVYRFTHDIIHRIDQKVYKPSHPWTHNIHAFLDTLRKQGFKQAPEPLGFDEVGNEILSYLDGETSDYPLPEDIRSKKTLVSSAKLLRCYHDVSTAYLKTLSSEQRWMLPVQEPQEVMCHGDFAPYNICFKGDEAVGIIDFETVHPGPRIWDIVYTLYCFSPFKHQGSPDGFGTLDEQIERAKLFLDAYDISEEERYDIPTLMVERLEALSIFLCQAAKAGDEKYQQHERDGHHLNYQKDILYIEQNEERIRRGLISE